MPEHLSPGVFVEETSFRSKSIEGVPTSVAAFVGPTASGPTHGVAELLLSFDDFERIYGGLSDLVFDGVPRTNFVAHAARTFFREGGKRLYVARIARDDDRLPTAEDYVGTSERDPDHATGNETTHTANPFTAAYQGVGGDGPTAAGGKECNTCHSATLKNAHANTSTSGGSVTCVECHTDSTLNSAAQVAADWSNDKCKDCHDFGAATTHDAYASAHLAEDNSRGCAESGSGCHGSSSTIVR